jgi:hypothetical protein
MDALGIIYPQYWQEDDAATNFDKHIAIIKLHYGHNTPFSTAGEFYFLHAHLFCTSNICRAHRIADKEKQRW